MPVALADPVVQRRGPRQEVLVRVDEMRREGDETLFGPHPALGGSPERAKSALQEGSDALRHPQADAASRGHLRFAVVLELPPKLDAGQMLRLVDPAGDVRRRRVAGDEPGFLVADPPLAQCLPQQRVAIETALQRAALGDRPLCHAELLLAVVPEAGEAQIVAGRGRLEAPDELAENLVPPPALLQVALQLPVQAPGI